MKAREEGQGDHKGQPGRPKLWHPSGGSVLLIPSQHSIGLGALPGSREKVEIWSFGRDLSNTGKTNKTHLWVDMAQSPPVCKLHPAW